MSEYIQSLRKLIGTRPILMCGANIFILDSQNHLLLQQRSDNGCWGLPGGALEPGEDLQATAQREALEEVGLVCKNLCLFDVHSGPELYYKYPNGDEVYNICISFICTEFEGQPTPDLSETRQVRFFPLNELPANISPPEKPVIADFLQKTALPEFERIFVNKKLL